MKTIITKDRIKLWISARETEDWATRPNEGWPCSHLRGKRLFAEFDSNGLCDLAIDGKYGDTDATEFNAITADHLAKVLPKKHALYFIIVGQFRT